MNNPFLETFRAVRDTGRLTPLLDPHDAERRAVETVEQALNRLPPELLAAAARDFSDAEYARLGFPSGLEPLLDTYFDRDYSDSGISEVTRALLSVAEIALGALPRELDRLVAEPVPVEANVYAPFVEGLTYLAIAGLLEKRVGTHRQAHYIFAARRTSMSARSEDEREQAAVAALAAYERQVEGGRLLPAIRP